MPACIYAVAGHDGGLYFRVFDRWWGFCWKRIGTVGTSVVDIATSGADLFCVKTDGSVYAQPLVGALPHQWQHMLAADVPGGEKTGYVKRIAIHNGSLYGALAKGGPVVRGVPALEMNWYTTSKGKCVAVAIHDESDMIYVVGVATPENKEPWVYKQPLRGLTKKTQWTKAFTAGTCQSLIIMDGGIAFGLGPDSRIQRCDFAGNYRHGTDWFHEFQSGLPFPVVAIAGGYPTEDILHNMRSLEATSVTVPPPPRKADNGSSGLLAGHIVTMTGLVNATHLNGRTGTVTRWDATKSRWQVKLEGGDIKAVKPENLLPGRHVRCTGNQCGDITRRRSSRGSSSYSSHRNGMPDDIE